MISTTRILVLTLGVAGLSVNRFSREAFVESLEEYAERLRRFGGR